jgi:hypothetical protein
MRQLKAVSLPIVLPMLSTNAPRHQYQREVRTMATDQET